MMVYITKMSNGWIMPVAAAMVNLTFEVAQNTNVLNPYINTQPNNNEFKNKSHPVILVIIPPMIIIMHKNVIERADKNIECFIFKLIP